MISEKEASVSGADDCDGYVEICPGRIFGFGGTLKTPSNISFIKHIRSGWIPVQGYLFRSQGAALVMDGGLAAHRELVRKALGKLLEGIQSPRYLASRWEPDALVNLPMILKQFSVKDVYSIGELSPLDFFTEFERAVATAQLVSAVPSAKLNPLRPGDVVAVGDLSIEVLRTSLRLLLTNWFYEHTTKSLFSADTWCLLAADRAGELVARAPREAEISVDSIEQSLLSKFDWLIGAKCEAVVEDLKSLQSERDIVRVCPSIGGVIEGRDAVRLLFERTIVALQRLSSKRRQSPLKGFDWNLVS